MLYPLNLHSTIYQLYLSKSGSGRVHTLLFLENPCPLDQSFPPSTGTDKSFSIIRKATMKEAITSYSHSFEVRATTDKARNYGNL